MTPGVTHWCHVVSGFPSEDLRAGSRTRQVNLEARPKVRLKADTTAVDDR
jgi:hypothetical protein